MNLLHWTHRGFVASTTLSFLFAVPLVHAQESTPPTEAAPASPVEPADAPQLAAPPATIAEPAPPPAAPSATVTAEGEADAAADAAAASAAAEAQSNRTEAVDQFKLNLYGFADFTYSTQLGNYQLVSPYSSFAVGKLNLYAGADLGDNWRSLAEVRFMYVPHGTSPTLQGSNAIQPRTDTSVPDYTDLGRPVKWGGITIERAWLEHTFHPALTVRVGSWLTPYGIWNVDHGSPVIIGVRRPFIIGEALFPEHQTGIETYGTFNVGPSQIGYHFTISNGRGAIDTYQDLDHNKGIGGRIFFKHDASFGILTIGASGYRGKYTDSHDEFSISSTGQALTNHVVTARYDELSLALDAKWEWSGVLVQSEAILNDVAYGGNHRPQLFALDGGPPGFAPDYRRLGIYALAGYRTPFLGIMPFFGGEYYDQGLYTFTPRAAAIWGGFNVRPTARVVLKAQYTHSWFTTPKAIPSAGGFNGLDFQAAWSF